MRSCQKAKRTHLVIHVNLILASSSNKIKMNKTSDGKEHKEAIDGRGDVAVLGNVAVFIKRDSRDITINSTVVIL